MANIKNYLIQFMASIQGDRLVTQKLRGIMSAQRGIGTSAKTATVHSGALIKALRRVAIVVPIWFAFRMAMMGVLQTVRFLVTTFIKLDDQLATIKTIVSANSKSINADMVLIRQTILSMAKDTRVPINDMAEAFYFLRTANLDTREAMQAFIPTIQSMVATGIGAKQIARAIAGAYNTMGDALGDNLTISEKFTKIADTLNFTFATQDVQMNELVDGYSKLAPFASGLTDTFEELVTMIGFLNTKMLRGGRTGRLLARGMIQIIKNGDKLRNIFGITFDPKAPLNFLGLMRQIKSSIGDTGKLTAEQQSALQKIFATRGRTPIQLLLQDMKGLDEALKNASENADGFTKKLADIKMNTIAGQLARLKNLTFLTGEAFLVSITGAKDFAQALKEMNNNISEGILGVSVFAVKLRVLNNNMKFLLGAGRQIKFRIETAKFNRLNEIFTKLNTRMNELVISGQKAGKSLDEIKATGEYKKLNVAVTEASKNMQIINGRMQELGVLSEDTELALILQRTVSLLKEESDILKATSAENQKKLNNASEGKEVAEQTLRIMQKLGFTASEIAQTRLDDLTGLVGKKRLEEDSLQVLQARNKLEIALLDESIKGTNKLISHELELMKLRGASARQILEAKSAIEDSIFGRANELTQLDRMLATEKAITQEEIKRKNLSGDTVKIWKIAKKQGEDIATNISKIIRGQIGLKDLSDKETQILAQQFRSKFEQLQAEKFFFEGEGKKIPIAERPERPDRRGATRGILGRARRLGFKDLRQERRKAQDIATGLAGLNITPILNFSQNLQIIIDPDVVAKKIKDKVWNFVEPKIEEALAQQITPLKKSMQRYLDSF